MMGEDSFKEKRRQLDKSLSSAKSLAAHHPGDDYLKQLVTATETQIRELYKEKDANMPPEDLLAKKQSQLKASKAKVVDLEKECEERLAEFRRQQEECLTYIDKAHGQHAKEIVRRDDLEKEIEQLQRRAAQGVAVQEGPPVPKPAPPAAPALPTDPDAIQILVNALAGVVASCGETDAEASAKSFRDAAATNARFLSILFNALHVKTAAATAAPGLAAPGVVGDQKAAVASAEDEGMERAPKRTATEAQLPAPQQLQQQSTAAAATRTTAPEKAKPAISMSRDALISSLGLAVVDADRNLEADEKAGVL